ncbi:MAG: YbaK/EbsC family protein [Tissierellia bacterium]|nr:YbaK/EbsC family protein [Tissierellia bacterium]
MSIDRAREYLKKWNFDHRIMEFDVSSATVELAAQAVNCEPERIAKSMAFMANDKCIMIVTAGDARIDNKKYKKRFKCKAKMVPPDELVTLIGHEIGGVCPFGIEEGVEVYLDESLKRFETVFPACGSSNSAIELTIEELERCSGYIEWVDVCKDWQ